VPRAALKACSVPGCPRTCRAGARRCSDHRKGTSAKGASPTQGVYDSPVWKRLRRRVLQEEPICRLCHTNPSTVADHIVELLDGGAPYDRANLQGSCHRCNVAKGQRAAQRRRARDAAGGAPMGRGTGRAR